MRFAGCAYLLVRDVVWCRSDPDSVQNRLKKSSISSVRLPDRVGCQFIQLSRGTGAKCLRSVRLVQFVQLSSRTLPALM